MYKKLSFSFVSLLTSDNLIFSISLGQLLIGIGIPFISYFIKFPAWCFITSIYYSCNLWKYVLVNSIALLKSSFFMLEQLVYNNKLALGADFWWHYKSIIITMKPLLARLIILVDTPQDVWCNIATYRLLSKNFNIKCF
ncbi:hypothetical protein CW304_22835 [Bacillus sp. UFRGS-B20]|nr:hypothetical protein CW304_22835 [Bacillus sp. UFRGS-B20]